MTAFDQIIALPRPCKTGAVHIWTPAERCARWRNSVQTNGHLLQMKTYPGARHAFDAPLAPHYFAGHYIGQDPAALADALIETRRFFDERLMSKR